MLPQENWPTEAKVETEANKGISVSIKRPFRTGAEGPKTWISLVAWGLLHEFQVFAVRSKEIEDL